MIREIISITLFVTVLIHGINTQERDPDKGRIVGGYQIDITRRPFQVALYTGGGFCGGAIISTTKIVTAAHCVRGKTANQLVIYAGSSHRSSGGVIRYVARIRIHPSYNPSVSNNFDVAVLTLSSPLVFSTKIRSIGLLSSRPAAGTNSVVSGWGSTSMGGTVQTYLREVQIPIVAQTTCRNQYGSSVITSNMICAGLSQGGKDSCQGDSGGPLTANGGLAGVVSFGYGCALAGYAGVYASVPELRSWILAN